MGMKVDNVGVPTRGTSDVTARVSETVEDTKIAIEGAIEIIRGNMMGVVRVIRWATIVARIMGLDVYHVERVNNWIGYQTIGVLG